MGTWRVFEGFQESKLWSVKFCAERSLFVHRQENIMRINCYMTTNGILHKEIHFSLNHYGLAFLYLLSGKEYLTEVVYKREDAEGWMTSFTLSNQARVQQTYD